MRSLAVIPARSGSKRLPQKNIKLLMGHPLIAYTIEAARQSSSLSDFVVSTNCNETARLAEYYGAAVPFLRPEQLATDEVRNIDVVAHALDFMERESGVNYDVVVLLQPTSPIREKTHIDQVLSLFRNADCDSVASTAPPIAKRDHVVKYISPNSYLKSVTCPDFGDSVITPLLRYNAAIYAVRRDTFMRSRKLIGDQQLPFIMDKFCSVDVDELADFISAESVLEYVLSDPEKAEQIVHFFDKPF